MLVQLYPEVPDRRRWTIARDVAVVVAVVLFAWLGARVHDRVASLGVLAEGVTSAGNGVQQGFDSVAQAVDGVPVVGDRLAGALSRSGEATGGNVASLGADGEAAVQDLIIYLAGRGEDVRVTAQALHWLPEGFGMAAINYRGVADSQGSPSEVASVADAEQFARHLRRAFPQARLHVVGRSLGTGVAIQLSARQPFESLQLVTPYDSMLEVAKKRFPLVPLSLLLRHRFNSIEHSKEVAAKTQVLLAERDDVVLHERSQKLIDAWPTPVSVKTVANSDHHNIMGLEDTWLRLIDFALTSVLPEPMAA
jgi:alpha/beta superfamily hydrolase